MLAVSALLFSSQFLFNQKFEEEYGSSLYSSLLFSFLSSLGGFVILFALNGFRMDFSPFSAVIAAISAVIGILYTIASVKSFEEVNLSAYSVFAMLGGMLLPFLYGIVFRSENITVMKILCCVFIIISLIFTIDFKSKSDKKIYYATVFMLNGLTGVCSIIHQSGANAVNSFSYLMLSRIAAFVICIPFLLCIRKTNPKAPAKNALLYSFGFSAFCGIGNLLVLLALRHIQASVQYPIITGGVMFASLIISIIRHEKIGKREALATVAAFVSTILIAL